MSPHPDFCGRVVSRLRRIGLPAVLAVAVLALVGLAGAMQDGNVSEARTAGEANPLASQVQRLMAEVRTLRAELAAARSEAADAKRELEELRSFIEDHGQYGEDYKSYSAVKAIAERDDDRRAAAEARAKFEAERIRRRERLEAARAAREASKPDSDPVGSAGFEHVGLGVYGGKMAFHYRTRGGSSAFVDYDTTVGFYYRAGPRSRDVDFSSMTISGSILNGTREVRNIGVAISFFDENGNQVGGEIVKINNARPDVPYPFTSTIEMALNRPFDTSSTYVLYSDPVIE